jgi:hypothetical protein
VKKTGAELPREPTKQNVISALIQKGVSLDHMTRGELMGSAAWVFFGVLSGVLGSCQLVPRIRPDVLLTGVPACTVPKLVENTWYQVTDPIIISAC